MKPYTVIDRLHCDGREYAPGQQVQLNGAQAERLLSLGVVAIPDAPKPEGGTAPSGEGDADPGDAHVESAVVAVVETLAPAVTLGVKVKTRKN